MMELRAVLTTVFVLNVLIGLVMVSPVMIAVGLVAAFALLLVHTCR
jgi:hypothetical protein